MSRKGLSLTARKGFTLIELLVVIAIIGILAALIIVSLSGARSKATDTQLKNNARNIDTALAQYYQDNQSAYPGQFDTQGGCNIASTAFGIATAAPTTCNTGGTGLNAYVSSGSTSQIFVHGTGSNITAAKYITSGGLTPGFYAQAWELKTQSESTALVGNGIYVVTAAAVTPGNSTSIGVTNGPNITGINTFLATNVRAFVTYGPQ